MGRDTLVPNWQGRTLRADEMAALLRQAQEAGVERLHSDPRDTGCIAL